MKLKTNLLLNLVQGSYINQEKSTYLKTTNTKIQIKLSKILIKHKMYIALKGIEKHLEI